MHIKKFVLFGIIGAVLLGLAGGALVFSNVMAQALTPTPVTPNGQVQPGMGMGGALRGGYGGYSEQDLATALGIDITKLQAAYAAANAEALKEAVSKGLITQAQADQITARGINNRPLGGLGFGANSGIDYNALLANALGIDVTKLQAAYMQAVNTNLDNAVKAGTITQAQADLEKARYALSNDTKFQSSLQAAYQAAIKQAVTDGVITQAQADQLLQNQTANDLPGGFGGLLGGQGGFGGSGGPRGFGLHGFGGGRGGNPAPQTPAQPTATPGSSS
jgi:ribosomal protein S20